MYDYAEKKFRIARNNDDKILKKNITNTDYKCVNTSISCLIIATYTLYKWLKVQIYGYEWTIVPDFNFDKNQTSSTNYANGILYKESE